MTSMDQQSPVSRLFLISAGHVLSESRSDAPFRRFDRPHTRTHTTSDDHRHRLVLSLHTHTEGAARCQPPIGFVSSPQIEWQNQDFILSVFETCKLQLLCEWAFNVARPKLRNSLPLHLWLCTSLTYLYTASNSPFYLSFSWQLIILQ